MNAYRAHLLAAADDHERDGYVIAAHRLRMWAPDVCGPRTLERALRATCEWDEDTLRRHLDAADRAARGG